MRKRTPGPSTVTHTNPFMEIRHSRVDFGSFAKDYHVVVFGPRVGVVACRDGSILLTRQYRFLVGGLAWEIPGGRIEAGETVEAAGLRECREETGMICRDFEPLVVYYPGLDNVDNRTTILCTTAVEQPAAFVPDETEVESIFWVPLQECLEMVFDQRILDALTVAGILAFAARRQHTDVNGPG